VIDLLDLTFSLFDLHINCVNYKLSVGPTTFQNCKLPPDRNLSGIADIVHTQAAAASYRNVADHPGDNRQTQNPDRRDAFAGHSFTDQLLNSSPRRGIEVDPSWSSGARCSLWYRSTARILHLTRSLQGGPKKRIPSFILGITSVFQHRF